jgi:hypothetical protein
VAAVRLLGAPGRIGLRTFVELVDRAFSAG